MHFTRVLNTINRPHFLAERGDDVVIVNFCQDRKSVRRQFIDESPPDSSGFGDSVFGFGDRSRNSNYNRSSRLHLPDLTLNCHCKHALGATDGKVFYIEDPKPYGTMEMWRIDCATGYNEYTIIPAGFVTRFVDSEYFIHTSTRSPDAVIYKWITGQQAEQIKIISIPKDFPDHMRFACGSKVLFLKIEGRNIQITSIDVISRQISRKEIKLDRIVSDDATVRWLCAKSYLIAVISGQVVYIDMQSLNYETAPTNLDRDGKFYPFAVDSDGYIYVLCPNKEKHIATVLRARDNALAGVKDVKVVIPKVDNIKAPGIPPTAEEQYINVHFRIFHQDKILFDDSMKVLCSMRLADVILRSPEMPHRPPNTRLKIYYRNEEVLTHRTPNFLRMKDHDSIRANFVDQVDVEEKEDNKRRNQDSLVQSWNQEDRGDRGTSNRGSDDGRADNRNNYERRIDNIDYGRSDSRRTVDGRFDVGFFSTRFDDVNFDTRENRRPPRQEESTMNNYEPRDSDRTRLPPKQPTHTITREMRPSIRPSIERRTDESQVNMNEPRDNNRTRLPPNKPAPNIYNGTEDTRQEPARTREKKQVIERKPRSSSSQSSETSSSAAPRVIQRVTTTDTIPTDITPAPEESVPVVDVDKAAAERIEKLLVEMQWLRTFVSGNFPVGVNGDEQSELELLKKKYARLLMMMGRSEVTNK